MFFLSLINAKKHISISFVIFHPCTSKYALYLGELFCHSIPSLLAESVRSFNLWRGKGTSYHFARYRTIALSSIPYKTFEIFNRKILSRSQHDFSAFLPFRRIFCYAHDISNAFYRVWHETLILNFLLYIFPSLNFFLLISFCISFRGPHYVF